MIRDRKKGVGPSFVALLLIRRRAASWDNDPTAISGDQRFCARLILGLIAR